MIAGFKAATKYHGIGLNDTDSQPRRAPRVIPRSEHTISRANVSSNALKVLYRLKNAGYAAFLVGGGVRDLLLDRHPKDFDVVTDAHPEDVKNLFRNCRLIGRRFRLAHVRFGREIIEVATFRATNVADDDEDRVHSDTGRIITDNVYGTIEEDIWRRDFTVNALYYNIADFSVWDYTSGLEDIRDRQLRLIGDPATRYREDPVRMLRAVRFAATLDFDIAAEARAPIRELAPLLADVPPARLYEELLKLFHTGHARRALDMLVEYDLVRFLFPGTAEVLEGEGREHALALMRLGLEGTDARIASDKPVTPMFLFAVLLWPAIHQRALQWLERGRNELEALAEASQEIVTAQQVHVSLPKRFSMPMREIIVMQRRFMSRSGLRAQRLLQHKRFRAAYDFLLLRSQCGEVDAETAEWWTSVQELSPAEQREAFGLTHTRAGSSRRRRGRGRSRRAEAPAREDPQ
jgi:poly(A) polymerase